MADFLYIDLGTDSTFYYAQTHKGFDGVSRRALWQVTRGKGFNVAEISDIRCNFGLLIPCERSVTAAIRDFIDLQRQQGNLSSAIRLFVLEQTRARAMEALAQRQASGTEAATG